MKTINVNLYTYAELDKEAQQKAREHFNGINTDYSWWEGDYDDFVSVCNTIGIHINAEQISFSGFWSQGDGSSFAAFVDTLAMIKAVSVQAWKAYAPTLELNLEPCPCSKRILALMEKGTIEVDISIERPHRGYWLKHHFDYSWEKVGQAYPNIEKEIGKLEEWASFVLEQMNRYLYYSLQTSYEYLISEQAIAETIESNNYQFTSDGTYADWLMKLEEARTK